MQSLLTPGQKAYDVSESTPNLQQYAYSTRNRQRHTTGRHGLAARLRTCCFVSTRGCWPLPQQTALGTPQRLLRHTLLLPQQRAGWRNASTRPRNETVRQLSGFTAAGGTWQKIIRFLGRCPSSRIFRETRTKKQEPPRTGARSDREPQPANQSNQQKRDADQRPTLHPSLKSRKVMPASTENDFTFL